MASSLSWEPLEGLKDPVSGTHERRVTGEVSVSHGPPCRASLCVSEGSETWAEGAGDGAGGVRQRPGGMWHGLEAEWHSEGTGCPFRKPRPRKRPQAGRWCDLKTGHRTPGAERVPALSVEGKRWRQVLRDRVLSGAEAVSLQGRGV